MRKLWRVVTATALMLGSLLLPNGAAQAVAPYDYVGSGYPGYRSSWGNTAWYMAGVDWGGDLGNNWWGVTGYTAGYTGQAFNSLYLGQPSGATGLVGCAEAPKEWPTTVVPEDARFNTALGYLLSKYAYGGQASLPGEDARHKAANAAALSWFIHEWNEGGTSSWEKRKNYWATSYWNNIDIIYTDVIAHKDALGAEALKYAGPYEWKSPPQPDPDIDVDYPTKTVKVIAPRNAAGWTPPGTVATLTATSGAVFSPSGLPSGVVLSNGNKTATWSVNSTVQNSSVTINLVPDAPTGLIRIDGWSSMPSMSVQRYKHPSDPSGNQRLIGGIAPAPITAYGDDPLVNTVSVTSVASSLLVKPGAQVSDSVSLSCEEKPLCSGAGFTGVSRLYGPFSSVPTSGTPLGVSRGQVSWSGTFNSSGTATVTSNTLTLSAGLAAGIYVWRETLTADPGGRWVETSGVWPEASEMFTVAAPSVSSQVLVAGKSASIARPGDTVSDAVSITGWPRAASGVSLTGSVNSVLWSANGAVGSAGSVTCDWSNKTQVQTKTVAITSSGVTGINAFTIPDASAVKCYGYSADVTLTAKRAGAADSTLVVSHPVTSVNQSVVVPIVTVSSVLLSESLPAAALQAGQVISDSVSVAGMVAALPTGGIVTGVLTSTLVSVPASITSGVQVCDWSLPHTVEQSVTLDVDLAGVLDGINEFTVPDTGAARCYGYAADLVLTIETLGRGPEYLIVTHPATSMNQSAGEVWVSIYSEVAEFLVTPGSVVMDEVIVSGGVDASADGRSLKRAWTAEVWSAPAVVSVDGQSVTCDGVDWSAGKLVKMFDALTFTSDTLTRVGEWATPATNNVCYSYAGTFRELLDDGTVVVQFYHAPGQASQTVLAAWPSIRSEASQHLVTPSTLVADSIWVANITTELPDGTKLKYTFTPEIWKLPADTTSPDGWCSLSDWRANPAAELVAVFPAQEITASGLLNTALFRTTPQDRTCYSYGGTLDIWDADDPEPTVPLISVVHAPGQPSETLIALDFNVTSEASQNVTSGPTTVFDSLWWTNITDHLPDGTKVTNMFEAEVWRTPARYVSKTTGELIDFDESLLPTMLGVFTCNGIDWTTAELFQQFEATEMDADGFVKHAQFDTPGENVAYCYSFAGWWHMYGAADFSRALIGGASTRGASTREATAGAAVVPVPLASFYHEPGQVTETILVFVLRATTGGAMDSNLSEFAWLVGGSGVALIGAGVKIHWGGSRGIGAKNVGPRRRLDDAEFDPTDAWLTDSYLPTRMDE